MLPVYMLEMGITAHAKRLSGDRLETDTKGGD